MINDVNINNWCFYLWLMMVNNDFYLWLMMVNNDFIYD